MARRAWSCELQLAIRNSPLPRPPATVRMHAPMLRASLFRWWKVGLIALSIVLFAVAGATRPGAGLQPALVLAALVRVATFLRVDAGDASVGFEAAVVFGAIVIFHSPSVALVSVLL